LVETKKRKEEPKVNIDIYKAWCKACGICVAFCPTGVLDKDELGYPFVKDIEKCINCGWCEIRCPDFAITVEKRAEGSKKVEERIERRDETAKSEEEGIGPERSITSGE
jgi:2-oxoglutarate ferredoxin oxidoreductase subunit delta